MTLQANFFDIHWRCLLVTIHLNWCNQYYRPFYASQNCVVLWHPLRSNLKFTTKVAFETLNRNPCYYGMERRLSKVFFSFYKDKLCYDVTYLFQYATYCCNIPHIGAILCHVLLQYVTFCCNMSYCHIVAICSRYVTYWCNTSYCSRYVKL